MVDSFNVHHLACNLTSCELKHASIASYRATPHKLPDCLLNKQVGVVSLFARGEKLLFYAVLHCTRMRV